MVGETRVFAVPQNKNFFLNVDKIKFPKCTFHIASKAEEDQLWERITGFLHRLWHDRSKNIKEQERSFHADRTPVSNLSVWLCSRGSPQHRVMRFSEFILTAVWEVREATYSPAGSKDRGSPKKLGRHKGIPEHTKVGKGTQIQAKKYGKMDEKKATI